MKTLKVLPFDGLLKRFPEHRITSEKKQFCHTLKNLIALDNKITKVGGAERYNTTSVGAKTWWAKRIYYENGGDLQRHQFAVVDRKIYKGQDAGASLQQVPINNAYDILLKENAYPIDTQMKVSGSVTTYLVDGENFFKFTANQAGEWERLNTLIDVDGNNIEPVYVTEYLDRLWVLVKNQNLLLFSKNREPENFQDSTDAGVIDLPAGNGGFPKGLIVHRGFLYVIHEDYFAPVTGASSATFGVAPGSVIYGFGTRAPRSLVNLKNAFGFLNSTDSEFYLSSGTLDSTSKQPLSYPIQLSQLMNRLEDHETVAHLDTEMNAIRISYVKDHDTSRNAEIIYSLNEEKWCGETYGRKISCYCQWNGNGDQNELYTGREDAGIIMKNNTGYNFDGTSIPIKLITGSYMVREDEDVQFEDFFADIKQLGSFSIPITYYMDTRLTTNAIELLTMQGEIINLGLIEIAEQQVLINRGLFKIDASKGRNIRFEIDWDALDRPFEMYGIYVHYNEGARYFSKYVAGR